MLSLRPFSALTVTGFLLAATSSTPALPQTAPDGATIVVGLAAPLVGSPSILGRQLLDGAEAAARTLNAGEDSSLKLVEVDTECSAEGGARAAQHFVDVGAKIVVGYLCTDSIEAALPILKDARVPLIDVGVRANRLSDRRARTGNLIWRIAPRSEAEAQKLAAVIAERWSAEPFGLIDDGTIAARNLTDTLRRLLADRGLQPQTVDNYRPAEEKQFGLVRRLQRTGVTRFFVAGDRPDIAIIIRDGVESGLTLQVIGGASLIDEPGEVPLAEGVVAIAPQTRFPELADPSASEAPDATPIERDAAGPQGYFGVAYAATEIAVAAIRKAKASGTGEGGIENALNDETFRTALGPVRFDGKGDCDLDLFRVYRWTGERFVAETGG